MRKILIIVWTSIMLTSSATLIFCDEEEQKTPRWYDRIKLSGELRTRFEGLFKYSAAAYPIDADYSQALARTRLTVVAQPSESIRAVIQFQDSRIWGEEPGTAASMDNIDLHQGFFQWSDIGGSRFVLKLGRQELSYGDERLVGAFGWSNVGRSFDAVKLSYNGHKFQVDGFHATTNETGPQASDATFSGVYATIDSLTPTKVDVYAFLKSDDRSIFASEIDPASLGDLTVWTFGLRVAGRISDFPFKYGVELATQTGNSSDDDIKAWAAHFEVQYNVAVSADLQLGAEYNFASGDADPHDGTKGTFDNLFPTNHNKYGYIDFVGWRNMKNLRLGASATPLARHIVSIDYHRFWTATNNDSVYRAGGNVLLAIPASVSSSDVGQELDLLWRFNPAKGLGILAGYSHFFAGGLFEQSLPAGKKKDADFLYLQTSLRF